MQEYQIIPITESQIEGFAAVVDSVAREGKGRYISFLEGPPMAMTREFVMDNIENNWPQLLLQYDGQVVGWCDITSLGRPVFSHVGKLGIGMLAEHRGKGHGRKLIEAALDAAQKRGLKRIELTVWAGNTRAIALYKKLGFEQEGVHQDAVCIEGEYHDLLSMAHRLF